MWVMPIQLRGLGPWLGLGKLLVSMTSASLSGVPGIDRATTSSWWYLLVLNASWSVLKDNNSSSFLGVLRACHGAFCWNCLDASFEFAAWRFMNWSPNDSWELSQLATNQLPNEPIWQDMAGVYGVWEMGIGPTWQVWIFSWQGKIKTWILG